MKKTMILLLALAMILCLCACGKVQNNTAVATPAETPKMTETPEEVVETPDSSTETSVEDAASVEAEAGAEDPEVVVEETISEQAELNQDEQELITLIGEDLNVVDDSNFAAVVPELIYHVGVNDGRVYMLEGILHKHDDEIFLGRTLKNGDELTEIMLPLRYLNKDINDDTWVSVTGIVNSENGITVFDILAIEAKEEAGNAVIEWTGHHH